MSRAWVVGFMMLITVDAIVVIATLIEFYPRALLLLLQVSPFVAAFISSYLSPQKKIILGTSMAIPAALLGVVVTFMYQLVGKPVDFPGLKGGLILFEISLVYGLVVCTLGGILGYFVSKKRGKAQREGKKKKGTGYFFDR